MNAQRGRVAPYVRRTARMRYSPDNPPPKEPPAELRLPNPGLWRVWYFVWCDHQPDETGRYCRTCRRWYPCQEVIDAEGGFAMLYEHARHRLTDNPARGQAPVFYPRGRNV